MVPRRKKILKLLRTLNSRGFCMILVNPKYEPLTFRLYYKTNFQDRNIE